MDSCDKEAGDADRPAPKEPATTPEAKPRSPALEAELAALEAMLPARRKGAAVEGDESSSSQTPA